MDSRDPRDYLPDVRDGLTHRERIVLQCLYDLQQERGGRSIPTSRFSQPDRRRLCQISPHEIRTLDDAGTLIFAHLRKLLVWQFYIVIFIL